MSRPSDLGEFHGCMTGDCPHENANDCVRALSEYVRELLSEVRPEAHDRDCWWADLRICTCGVIHMRRAEETAEVGEHLGSLSRVQKDRDEIRRLRKAWQQFAGAMGLDRTFQHEVINRAKQARIVQEAFERSGLDVSPCHKCGLPVITVPDGMPAFCEECHDAEE